MSYDAIPEARYVLCKGAIDSEKAKEIKAILVLPPSLVEFKSGGWGITGSAIFSTFERIDNPTLVIEIAVIVILLLVYLSTSSSLLTR
jgi:hypothetical protein